MALRVEHTAPLARDVSPISPRFDYVPLPHVADQDPFREVVRKLSIYIKHAVDLPSTFDQLRTTAAGDSLRALVDHLHDTCANPAIVNALLALKWHYDADHEHLSLGESRSSACEIVAWRLLTRLSDRRVMDLCLYEIPIATLDPNRSPHQEPQEEATESSPLLPRPVATSTPDAGSAALPVGGFAKKAKLINSLPNLTTVSDEGPDDLDPTAAFRNLNALEIAAIANAKRFLSQHVVQRIISAIWNGDIIFWDSLSVRSRKEPCLYDASSSDPFARLRVPKYLKCWEVLFFALFLFLYYLVLIERDEKRLTPAEMALYVWIAAFFYDELSELMDAGSVFYATDIWNLFDMIMIFIGFIFAALRVVGIAQQDKRLNALAFDVLALEALFVMPRICSILSLSPYWGILIPCLKEMGKDFVKFMVLVMTIYLGFLTTFSLIGRDVFTLSRMAGILTKIFFGSSYVGFDVMHQIDPLFGPPLMIIFITLTSILLTGSLTGILSNSFSRVITHARDEYLYVYSVYVLEASTSNRLTHFYPPFNLVALFIFRPLRLIFSRDEKFRAGRILLLKLTHLPIVAAITLYECLRPRAKRHEQSGFREGQDEGRGGTCSEAAMRRRPSSNQSRQPRPAGDGQAVGNAAVVSEVGWEDEAGARTTVEMQLAELQRKVDHLTSILTERRKNED